MTCSDRFEITSERIGTVAWTIDTGELDIATAPQLRATTNHYLVDHDAEIIVSDLADVSFIDSSGLHALMDAARQPERVRIIPSAACRRFFDLVGVADWLPLIGHHNETHRRRHANVPTTVRRPQGNRVPHSTGGASAFSHALRTGRWGGQSR
jgi:anti-sigma B factor antagonist